jgi:amino acid adenylation domain-containing protein
MMYTPQSLHRGQLCIHDLVTRQAAAHPDRVAVVDRTTELTYGELDMRANQLAAHLRGLGVHPDSAVGVFLERSAELVVTFLAILKAGGNYVPLDPGYPADRLNLMLNATAAPVIVTDRAHAARLPAAQAAIVVVDDLAETLAGLPKNAPDVRVHPDHLAYTMFTSGSTGTPKGVVVTHRGVVRLVQDPGYIRLDGTETLLHQSSTSFDAATFEIWGALTNGARLVVAPGKASAAELGRLLRKHVVTTAFFTTGLFHLMVDEHLNDLTGLRQLLTGGDVLSPARAARLLSAHPGCRLVNAYGPTEVTTFTSCEVVSPPADGAAVPIGRPINHTGVRLLDTNLDSVPDGGVGEVCVGGDGLARGYLADPALTAARFVPDPRGSGQRLYRTGDLARHLPDGRLEYLGRVDRQIKRRGVRIEPGEIEAAVRWDPHVRDVVVLPEGDTAEGRVLVAYLIPDGAASAAPTLAADVRERLRGVVPEHLVPDRWVVVDTFPLNANGKVDRTALAILASAGSARGGTDTRHDMPGPGTESEVKTTLLEIWREIFALDEVGPHDDFFDLGGHSLLASRMVSRIRKALGVEMPLAQVFDHPTVAEIAELIEAA